MGFREGWHPGVREDLRELQRFNRKYENPLEPVIWDLYGQVFAGSTVSRMGSSPIRK
jgi:hypothetical protein